MTIDPKVLQKSIQQKTGLLEKLGDAGTYIAGLFGGGAISSRRIEDEMQRLHTYRTACRDQIDEIGQEMDRIIRDLGDLKQKLDRAKSLKKSHEISVINAQLRPLVRAYSGYETSLNKWSDNAVRGEVLLASLRDLLILLVGPMNEDDIDSWTGKLKDALDEAITTGRALDELTRESGRSGRAVLREVDQTDIDGELERILAPDKSTQRECSEEEKAIEKLVGKSETVSYKPQKQPED